MQAHNLPLQPTPFIGRDEEIAEITRLLTDPACRLLTLVGPGGIGKTRLSTQAAAELLDAFENGIYFVGLQATESGDYLVSAIADALNFPLLGQEAPEIQLFNYLQDKQMLLLLDNFEQLLGHGGARTVAKLLKAAPAMKILTTSREVLNLREEWLYPVQGLAFPPNGPNEDARSYGAVQLFIEHARRVHRHFSLEDELADVVRICQLVEGTPLALELAASWTKTMRCAVIASEIRRNIDFLATNVRNVPDRQRSIRAVFDQSWQLLTEQEQNVFKRMSVFVGGFSRKAAERVAGADWNTLSALVDKSLLRLEPEDRYQIHELLRQYAAEQLVQSPDDVAIVYDAHRKYYIDFLHQRTEGIVGARQREVIEELNIELENIRAAWWQAVAQVNLADIRRGAETFYDFCDFQSRFQEVTDIFEKTIEAVSTAEPGQEKDLTLAQLLVLQGYNYIRVGKLDKASLVAKRSQAIYDNVESLPPPGFGNDPYNCLGLVADVLGNYEEAITYAEKSRQRNEARSDKHNLSIAFYILASSNFAQGRYEAARQFAKKGYALTKETGNRWMMAYILSVMGNVARAVGDYTRARQYYQAGYAVKEEFKDPEGMAAALNQMAKVACLQHDFREAEHLYGRSHAIYLDINDRGGLATSLHGLGNTALATGKLVSARRYYYEALHIATDMGWTPITLSLLVSVGDLLWQEARHEQAVELVGQVLHHSSSDQETRDRAKQLRSLFESELSADAFAAASERGQSASLDSMIMAVQADLSMPKVAAGAGAEETEGSEATVGHEADAPESLRTESPELVEQLTPRELEVLRLIADGLTNQQVADELIISVGTVKSYTSQIYGKLNVGNRTQAVARARELHLLP